MIKRRFTGKSIKPVLSQDFASKMIEKEAELDRDCSIDVINELVEIYTEAIEFFSFIHDKKSQDFQEKMQKLFLRPEVMQALRLKPTQSSQKTQPSQKPVTMEERKQEHNQKLFETTKAQEQINLQKSREKELNRVINYSKLRNIEAARKAAMDFKTQDEDLDNRLASRKKSMLTKSMESFRYLNSSQNSSLNPVKEEPQDASGVSFVKLIEEEEETDLDSLEVIMEKFCQEKAQKTALIQVKYESQLAQLEGQGSLFDQVRIQLKKDMQSELLSLSSELESRKAAEIHSLRRGHRKNSISCS